MEGGDLRHLEGVLLPGRETDLIGVGVVEVAVAAIDRVRLQGCVRQSPHIAEGVQQDPEAAALQNKAGVAQPGNCHTTCLLSV